MNEWLNQPSTLEFVEGILAGQLLMLLSAITLIRIGRTNMDRLTEKLQQAAGVNARVAASIEQEADDLIAREHAILDRKAAAFEPHHTALNQRMKELDRFEDSLQILENASPLKGGGDLDGKTRESLLKAVETAIAETPATQQPGSGASTEPGTASGADVH
jgi:Skp family chaperone for outer membrane proteins